MLLIWTFVWCSNVIFGADLSDKIYDSFKKIYDNGISNDYIESAYWSKYSKDPFWDAFDDIDNMQMQLKVAWAQYIEDELAANNCSLSKKKIWWILYYYVPEFRAEIVRKMKTKGGDYKAENFIMDQSTIKKYCEEYFVCMKLVWYGGRDVRWLSAATSSDIATNCKEYFQRTYAIWEANEMRMQWVKKSRAWNDKFWNATTDDSPYDIMSDLNNIGVLLYEDSVEPLTPVFYNLPVFSNSTRSLLNSKQNLYVWVDNENYIRFDNKNIFWVAEWFDSWAGVMEIWWLNWNWWLVNLWNLNLWLNQDSSKNNSGTIVDDSELKDVKSAIEPSLPSTYNWNVSDIYDELIEWLWAKTTLNKWRLFYGNLCSDDEEEFEPEWNVEWDNSMMDGKYDLSVMSEEKYQEAIDYMMATIDQYVKLSEKTKIEVLDIAGDISRYNSAATPEQIDNAIEDIKNCRKSCEGLRRDQKASCKMMCTCKEWDSSEWGLFDPEKNAWLWPILMIKSCSIPGVDTKFSIWWKKIVSIEEWTEEIFWVVDKLSREWKLWIWTKQSNFLDSSTKEMKFSDLLSFSIDMEYENLLERLSETSQQYEEMNLKRNNKSWQSEYNISNSLNDKSHKNQYLIVWSNTSNQSLNSLDQIESSNADRYVSISDDLRKYLDQQGSLREYIKSYIEDMYKNAQVLYSKKG